MQTPMTPKASISKCSMAAVILGISWHLGSAMAAAPIPQEALEVIKTVSAAAARRDFATLDKLMVREFTWSFGGDRDARQALDAWRDKRDYLTQLNRITSRKCEFITKTIIECPAKARTGHRAGFERTTDGWRMTYFVAGD
jgi:hypothetical protein